MTILPRLYKSTKTGAIQICDISYENDQYHVTFGQLDGKLQTNSTTCQGTNIGRANERTPIQQAEFEALADHKKKIKSGYSLTMETTSEVTLPAKVKVYQDNLKNIKFPAHSTNKLNGVNGLYKRNGSDLTLYSRGGEVYPEIPHLSNHIHTIMDELNSNELNGELYIHGEHLQDIQSAVKKPNELSPRLTFNIFDIADSKEVYTIRSAKLSLLHSNLYLTGHTSLQHIGFITSVTCHSHEDIEAHFNQAILNGYEGTVIYNADHLYIYNQRSSNAFKYKKALDAEFLIIGYELDKQGNPTLICQSEGGPFKVRPTGTQEYRKQLLADMPNNIGKYYKIEYETLSKSLVPLKPIGLGIRTCDSNGNPLE